MSRILIVEDEESIAELEKDYLELSGFEVEIENNGETGLKRGMEEDFDLLILDLMLPGVDGFEICKKIFLYAYNCIVSTCKREIERNPWDDRGTYRKAVNAYGWGFCEGLRDAFEAQKEEHQEWGLVMVTPQAVVEEADGLGKPRAIGRNEVDMDTLGARQKGYRDGLKFDPNSRLEGRPERAQLAPCR